MFRHVSKFWCNAFAELVHNLRSVGWARFGLNSLLLMWILGLVLLLMSFGTSSLQPWSDNSSCPPGSPFELFPQNYNYWKLSGFFQVTMPMGQLTFEQAKGIDVTWDVVCGRGGQGLLALISWKVFAQYLTTVMEVGAITYRSFMVMFIKTGPSIISTASLFRDFALRQPLRSKVAMTFIIATMSYVLAFPTLASAMTGYTTMVKAYVEYDDLTYVPLDDFHLISYVIHDGHRIQKTDDFVVNITAKDRKSWTPILSIDMECSNTSRRDRIRPISDSECDFKKNLSKYIDDYGFSGEKTGDSKFMGINLTSAVLNISARVQNQKDKLIFDHQYLDDKGSCQNSEHYQWGFSFIQFFLNIIFLLIWTIGMYMMWRRSKQIMRFHNIENVVNDYEAVIQLSSALQKGYNSQDTDLDSLRERKIVQRVRNAEGGRISFQRPLSRNPPGIRKTVKAWLRKEKWWLIAFLSAFLFLWSMFAVAVHTGPIGFVVAFFWSIGLNAGFLAALIIGSTAKSKMLIVLFSSTIPAIVVPPLYVS